MEAKKPTREEMINHTYKRLSERCQLQRERTVWIGIIQTYENFKVPRALSPTKVGSWRIVDVTGTLIINESIPSTFLNPGAHQDGFEGGTMTRAEVLKLMEEQEPMVKRDPEAYHHVHEKTLETALERETRLAFERRLRAHGKINAKKRTGRQLTLAMVKDELNKWGGVCEEEVVFWGIFFQDRDPTQVSVQELDDASLMWDNYIKFLIQQQVIFHEPKSNMLYLPEFK